MTVTHAQEFFIQWHLTERCNLKCLHCYQTGRGTEEITLPEAKEVIREVSEMVRNWEDAYDMDFSTSFTVTGGEPFLRKDLFEIIDDIRTAGFDVSLLSNGILIDREKAKRLAGLDVTGVQISIEGPVDVHDQIRGKGSYAASMKGVKNVMRAGIPVTLNATLSGINAVYFRDLISIALSEGVPRLGFSRLVPSGTGKGLMQSMLKKEDVRSLYEEILSLKYEGLEIVTGDPVASQMSCAPEDEVHDFPAGGCAAGLSGLTLMPDGTITPCRRLPIPIGNVRTDSIREVWASSPVLSSLRDRGSYKGKCGQCRRWPQCRGCRAIAYAHSQATGEDDFLAEDPQCFLEP